MRKFGLAGFGVGRFGANDPPLPNITTVNVASVAHLIYYAIDTDDDSCAFSGADFQYGGNSGGPWYNAAASGVTSGIISHWPTGIQHSNLAWDYSSDGISSSCWYIRLRLNDSFETGEYDMYGPFCIEDAGEQRFLSMDMNIWRRHG